MSRAGLEGDDALAADPFEWQVTSDQRVLVSRGGRQITVVGGAIARKLIPRLESADGTTAQQLLARATGNYKHGNERR